MGGTGSGWQWGRKMQVGECAALSAPLLQRQGILRPNVHLRGVIGWTRDGGIPFASIEYTIRTFADEGDLVPTLAGASVPSAGESHDLRFRFPGCHGRPLAPARTACS